VELSFKIFKGVLWRRQASKDDVLVALSRLAFHWEYMAHPLRKLLRAPTHAQKEEIRWEKRKSIEGMCSDEGRQALRPLQT